MFLKGILSLLFFVAFAVKADTSSFLSEDSYYNKIFKQIAKKRIGAGINIFSWDQIDGLNLSLRYRIDAEPSYINGFYTRVDRYSIETEISPGSWFDGWSGPIGFDIGANSEILFARQFNSQAEALNVVKNPPYDLVNLPITADAAIKHLKVGDFVSLTGKLNLVLSAEAFSYATSVINIKGSAYVMLMGQFNIHFYKLEHNRVRLKIIANRENGYGAGINSSEVSGFKALGISSVERYVGSGLRRFINLNPITLSWSKNQSDLVMIDYVFDLNNPEAVLAYNHFMSAKMRLKQLEILNPVNNIKDLQSIVFADLTQIEDISWQDKNLPVEQRRVDRLFKGRSFTDTERRRFKLGLRIVDYESGTHFSSSRNIIADRDNNEKYFLFDTKNPFTNLRFFWGFYGDDISKQSSLLFETDKQFEPEKFLAFNVTQQKVIRSVSRNDFFEIKNEVEKLLPSEISGAIDWQNWNFNQGDLVNGFFTDEVFFKTEALSSVYSRNPEKIRYDFEKYLRKVGTPVAPPSSRSAMPSEQGTCQGAAAPVECYEVDIQVVANRLSDVLNPLASPALKRESFLYLNENNLFNERGAGFLLSIIPAAKRDEVVSYNMSFRAKGVKDISFKYGSFADNNIYRQFLYILGVLNNRSYDLRLFVGDSQGYQPAIVMQKN